MDIDCWLPVVAVERAIRAARPTMTAATADTTWVNRGKAMGFLMLPSVEVQEHRVVVVRVRQLDLVRQDTGWLPVLLIPIARAAAAAMAILEGVEGLRMVYMLAVAEGAAVTEASTPSLGRMESDLAMDY